jgi:hypothetical protein
MEKIKNKLKKKFNVFLSLLLGNKFLIKGEEQAIIYKSLLFLMIYFLMELYAGYNKLNFK